MEITPDTTNLVTYLARLYADNIDQYEDMTQEGHVAVLETETKDHLYFNVKNAVRYWKYKEKKHRQRERNYGNMSALNNRQQDDDDLILLENVDYALTLLEKAPLKERERDVIRDFYLNEMLLVDIRRKYNCNKQYVYALLRSGMATLKQYHTERSKRDANR